MNKLIEFSILNNKEIICLKDKVIKEKIELKSFINPFQLKINLDGLTNRLSSLVTLVIVENNKIVYNRNYNFESETIIKDSYIWCSLYLKPESKIIITLRNYVTKEEANIEFNFSDYLIMAE